MSADKLHDVMREAARKVVREERGPLDLKSLIDASYAGGNPKTLRPGESAVGSETKKILAPYGSSFIRASDAVLEKDVNGDTVILGKIIDAPAGIPATGAYHLLPAEMPSSTAFTAPTQTANGIRAYRFRLGLELRVATLHYEIVTGAGGTSGGFAIYSSDASTKLIDAGGQSFVTNGVISVDVTDTTLPPGWYWLAWVIDSATPTLRSVAAPANFGVLNNGTVQKGTSAGSSTAGSLPASLGAITGSTFDLPLCKLQA